MQSRSARRRLGGKVNCFVFAKDVDAVAAVWHWGDDGKDVLLSFERDSRHHVPNMMGNPVQLSEQGKTVLRLNGNPVYVEGRGMTARELRERLNCIQSAANE